MPVDRFKSTWEDLGRVGPGPSRPSRRSDDEAGDDWESSTGVIRRGETV